MLMRNISCILTHYNFNGAETPYENLSFKVFKNSSAAGEKT